MEYEFLIIAFYLSILSYYLGVLLYMIPVPFYSVKKWAPTLMVDGVFSAILIFSYTLFLSLINYLGGLFGSDWNSFFLWLGFKTSIVTTLLVVLKFIGVSLSLGGLQFIANSLITSLINSLTNVLFLLLSLSIASTIILTYGSKILALGILLHSIPFRLTRVSGSMMISVIMVFSIGLPLMPAYVEVVSQPPGFNESVLVEYGVAYGYINIVDMLGSPIPYPVLNIYTSDKSIILAKYVGNKNGVIDATSPSKGFPSAKEYVVMVDYGGLQYWKSVDPLREYVDAGDGRYNLTITTPIVSLRGLRYIYLEDCILQDISLGKVVFFNVSVEDKGVVYIVVNYNDDAYVFLDNTLKEPDVIVVYNWYGVDFKALKYFVDSGVHSFRVYIKYSTLDLKPSVDEVYYVRDSAGIQHFEPSDLVKPVVYLVFNLFIAPLTYVAILFSASVALARLLGGASPAIARIILVGA